MWEPWLPPDERVACGEGCLLGVPSMHRKTEQLLGLPSSLQMPVWNQVFLLCPVNGILLVQMGQTLAQAPFVSGASFGSLFLVW